MPRKRTSAPSRSIRNYTSTVPVATSILRLENMLVHAGVREIRRDYDDAGRCSAFIFVLFLPNGRPTFRLPIKIDQVLTTLRDDLGLKVEYAQAERTAWKNLVEMVELMLVNVRLGSVKVEEVLLPYLYNTTAKQTLFEHMQQTNFLLESTPQS